MTNMLNRIIDIKEFAIVSFMDNDSLFSVN